MFVCGLFCMHKSIDHKQANGPRRCLSRRNIDSKCVHSEEVEMERTTRWISSEV